ncbi:MAG: tetratricopeptide repeat-containing sensor histidine kinase [Bacteroidota bacterium]
MLLVLVSICLRAQDQRVADSLLQVLDTKPLSDSLRILLYEKVAFNHGNAAVILEYAEKTISLATSVGNVEGVYSGYSLKGTAYQKQGEMDLALESFFKSADIAERHQIQDVAIAYLKIADAYTNMGSLANGRTYYKSAIEAFAGKRGLLYLGSAMTNLGYSYYMDGLYDSALFYHSGAMAYFDSVQYDIGTLYCIGNIGLVHAKMGEHDLAERRMMEAISGLEEYEDYYAIADFGKELADIYRQRDDFEQAIAYAESSHDLAQSQGLRVQQRDASYILYQTYRDMERHEDAMVYLNAYYALRDSITNAENIQRMADLRTAFEVGQKQAEVDLLEAQRQNQKVVAIALSSVLGLTLVLAFVLYRNNNQKLQVNRLLKEQKSQLEDLNHTKDRFFSIISHDLRGPVNAFHGVSRMIKFFAQNKQIDQLEDLAEEIDKSVDRLSALLDNLLDWAVQQQGHVPYIPEKLDMHEMADDLVQIFQTMAKSKRIHLSSEVPERLLLWGDRNTVHTIIRNIVNNAIKFTPEGGQVAIRAKKEDDTAIIEVSDTGVGIPSEKLEELFRLQAKKSTWGTSGEKGLGLGLQLVNEFIELNHGKVEVSSKEGQGSIFRIWLPLFGEQEVAVSG